MAETRSVFLKDLNSPFGMALVGQDLYVANTDAIVRFPYMEGQREITEPGIKVADLPAGELNHHWTKNLIASRDGTKLYVTVGSNSDHGENGIDKEERRAAILEVDLADGQTRRIRVGPAQSERAWRWEPQTGMLWTVVNERDELGSDLVPDYLTSVKDGGFYGWPYSYYGQHVDSRVKPQRPISSPRRSRPTMRSATTSPRSAWRSPKARCCRSGSATAPSSASTARGTARRAAATR